MVILEHGITRILQEQFCKNSLLCNWGAVATPIEL